MCPSQYLMKPFDPWPLSNRQQTYFSACKINFNIADYQIMIFIKCRICTCTWLYWETRYGRNILEYTGMLWGGQDVNIIFSVPDIDVTSSEGLFLIETHRKSCQSSSESNNCLSDKLSKFLTIDIWIFEADLLLTFHSKSYQL